MSGNKADMLSSAPSASKARSNFSRNAGDQSMGGEGARRFADGGNGDVFALLSALHVDVKLKQGKALLYDNAEY